MGEPLQQMDHHLDALRQAAEIAERANLGKVAGLNSETYGEVCNKSDF